MQFVKIACCYKPKLHVEATLYIKVKTYGNCSQPPKYHYFTCFDPYLNSSFVTGPAKTGHVGTNNTSSPLRSYLSTVAKYMRSVACTIKPNAFLLSVQNFIAIAYWYKKL